MTSKEEEADVVSVVTSSSVPCYASTSKRYSIPRLPSRKENENSRKMSLTTAKQNGNSLKMSLATAKQIDSTRKMSLAARTMDNFRVGIATDSLKVFSLVC